MSDYKLSSNPNNCTGYTQLYPQRIKELERQRASRNPEPKDKVLTRKQASELLQVSMSTLDRFVKARSIPFTKVGGRVYFSLFKLREWLLSKEEVPETWNEQSFRAELIDKGERIRSIEISNRIVELNEIVQKLYKVYGEGLEAEENAEQKKIFNTAFEEVMFLSNERDEIQEKGKQRLKEFLGIDKKDK